MVCGLWFVVRLKLRGFSDCGRGVPARYVLPDPLKSQRVVVPTPVPGAMQNLPVIAGIRKCYEIHLLLGCFCNNSQFIDRRIRPAGPDIEYRCHLQQSDQRQYNRI